MMLMTTRALEKRLVVVVQVRVNARVAPGEREEGRRTSVTPTAVALEAPPLVGVTPPDEPLVGVVTGDWATLARLTDESLTAQTARPLGRVVACRGGLVGGVVGDVSE